MLTPLKITGRDNGSLAHRLLRAHLSGDGPNKDQQTWSLDDIKGAAGAVFIAGADTVSYP